MGVGFGMGFPVGFGLILSYFGFDFFDFVFRLSDVEMSCSGGPVIVGW